MRRATPTRWMSISTPCAERSTPATKTSSSTRYTAWATSCERPQRRARDETCALDFGPRPADALERNLAGSSAGGEQRRPLLPGPGGAPPLGGRRPGDKSSASARLAGLVELGPGDPLVTACSRSASARLAGPSGRDRS